MFVLSFAWLWLFVVELARGLTQAQERWVLIIWGTFILEFLIKLFLAPRKLKYIKNNGLTILAPSGTKRCMPVAPEVLQKLVAPALSSTSFVASATSTTSSKEFSPGSRSSTR